jgi:bifunctional non-homologous end joining protein LigD
LRGSRPSGAWVKFKITKSQEFVIGGYTLPEGNRKYFGSLLVGYPGPDGLTFAGRVGTGFSDKVLANLYAKFQKLKPVSV